MLVLTADQKRSTLRGDRVPEALQALAALGPPGEDSGVVLPFERTVGDEVQALLATPRAALHAVVTLVRLGGWRIGLGLGDVETPLPATTRAASGPAYLAARRAVGAAHASPADLCVVRAVGADGYGEDDRAHQAESALWLLVAVLRRRTAEGWEIVEMADTGLSGREIADRLRITPSAVSQRLARAAVHEARRGIELAEALLAEADA